MGLAVAAVVEPERSLPAGGLLDGADSAKGRKGRLALHPLGVVPHSDQDTPTHIPRSHLRRSASRSTPDTRPSPAKRSLTPSPSPTATSTPENLRHRRRPRPGPRGRPPLPSRIPPWTASRTEPRTTGDPPTATPRKSTTPRCGPGHAGDWTANCPARAPKTRSSRRIGSEAGDGEPLRVRVARREAAMRRVRSSPPLTAATRRDAGPLPDDGRRSFIHADTP